MSCHFSVVAVLSSRILIIYVFEFYDNSEVSLKVELIFHFRFSALKLEVMNGTAYFLRRAVSLKTKIIQI